MLVLNVVDGCIPSDLATGTPEEIEEERRLLYVAMTRARDHLQLMHAAALLRARRSTAHGDRHVYAAKSRFLPKATLPFFDQRAWPVADPASAAAHRLAAAATRVRPSTSRRGFARCGVEPRVSRQHQACAARRSGGQVRPAISAAKRRRAVR